MKRSLLFGWLPKRFLLILFFGLAIILMLAISPNSYGNPSSSSSKWFSDSAKITGIYEKKGSPQCKSLPSLFKEQPSKTEPKRTQVFLNQEMQALNNVLVTLKCWVVLSFPKRGFTATVGGHKTTTTYRFPSRVKAERLAALWQAGNRVIFQANRGRETIYLEPVAPKGSASSNFPVNLFAQATAQTTTDLPQTSIPSQENVGALRYCSAISDFSVIPKVPVQGKPPYEAEYGKAWGIGISDRGWDLFSQNDPCRKALQECETANQNLRDVKNPKLGTTCSIASDGIGLQPLDDSSVILSLDCSGDKEKPFSRRFIPYETQAAKINEALIKDFKKKARDDGARSCIFNIYPDIPGALLISPEQPKEGSVEIRADGSGKKMEFVTVNGSVGVIPIEKLVKTGGRATPEIVPHHNKYFFCEENDRECEKDERDEYVFKPVSEPEIDQIKSQEPVNLLPRDLTIFSPEDTIGILTISGKRINPWKDLGFYISFPSGLNFPSEWKAVVESDELKTVLNYIQQKESTLAFSYVDGALARLEHRDPELASTFRGEITNYINPKIDRRLLAFDIQSIASVQSEQMSLDGSISFETVTKNYVKNLRKTRSSVVKYVSNKSFAVGNFKIWEVKAQVNLQGAYGAPKRGYKKEPAIGAGRTVFVEGTDGKPVTLIQTSYFINWQNRLFKLDFITTQERDKLFTSNSVYTKVLESFRIVKPYQAGERGT